MSRAGGTSRSQKQRGAILLGLAGGMLVVAGGFAGAYYVVGTRSVAVAATTSIPPARPSRTPPCWGRRTSLVDRVPPP